jgi:type 1 glutamine amidotransferase
MLRTLFLTGFVLAVSAASAAAPLKCLIVDGQNNHKWQETTPVLRKQLEEGGLFACDVLTSPPAKGDFSAFRPDFQKYAVVVSNYNGEPWPQAVEESFEKYVRAGGGFVSYHAADNAFPEWKAFNDMIALGGWGGRDEKSGPMARFRDGKLVIDRKPGKGGHHGQRHEYQIATRDPQHPIMKGMPALWMHAKDELYDSMRGPAANIHLLGTAFSKTEFGGTGENEPLLFTVKYGSGRVFHTMLGHDTEAMNCMGFIVTLRRGAEWAATGKVKQKLPPNLPSADKVALP